MNKKFQIVHLYASSSFEGGDEWSVQFAKDLSDSFLQLDDLESVIEQHDVSMNSIDQFHQKIHDADYVIVSVNDLSLDGTDFVNHFNDLTERFDSSKIFKLVHTPILRESPVDLERLIGYRFYELESLEQLNSKAYWNKVVDLTYDILYRNSDREVKGAVYLAETIEKYESVRDDVKRELLKRGYNVLPYRSHDLNNFVNSFEEDLSQSILSIHLIGSGDSDNITSDNIADHQNEVASQYALTNPDLKRIIWLEEEGSDLIEDEYLYIEKFKRNRQSLNGAEIVQVPTEKLKNIVISRLTDENDQLDVDTKLSTSDHQDLIYVITEQEDVEEFKSIQLNLEKKGVKVMTMDFDDNQLNVFGNHRKMLATCDGVIVFHTRRNTKWLKMKLLDLMKAPGYGRKRPFKVKAIYVKETGLLEANVGLLNNTISFSSDDIFDEKSVNEFCRKLSSYA